MLQGLRLAAAGLRNIAIESDSMEVVKTLNKESDPSWNQINLVRNVRCILISFESIVAVPCV